MAVLLCLLSSFVLLHGSAGKEEWRGGKIFIFIYIRKSILLLGGKKKQKTRPHHFSICNGFTWFGQVSWPKLGSSLQRTNTEDDKQIFQWKTLGLTSLSEENGWRTLRIFLLYHRIIWIQNKDGQIRRLFKWENDRSGNVLGSLSLTAKCWGPEAVFSTRKSGLVHGEVHWDTTFFCGTRRIRAKESAPMSACSGSCHLHTGAVRGLSSHQCAGNPPQKGQTAGRGPWPWPIHSRPPQSAVARKKEQPLKLKSQGIIISS